MANFEEAVQKVLRHEGVVFDGEGQPVPGKTGYVEHPDDPGGETNYGITVKVARKNGYKGPMMRIPYTIVLVIYRKRYWDRLRGDMNPDQQIAEELFDTAVNMGVKKASRFLQRTLNALNVKGTKYPDLKVDGQVGPKTMAILEQALGVALWYRLVILRALDSLQAVRYIELAEHDEKFESFMPGWLRTRVGVAE